MSGGILSFGGGGGGSGPIPGTASAADIAAALALLSGDEALRWVGTPEGDVQRAGTGRAVALPADTLASSALALLETLPDNSSVSVGAWLQIIRNGLRRAYFLDFVALGSLAGAAALIGLEGLEDDSTVSLSASGLSVLGSARLAGLSWTGNKLALVHAKFTSFALGEPSVGQFYGAGIASETGGKAYGRAYTDATGGQWRQGRCEGTLGEQTVSVPSTASTVFTTALDNLAFMQGLSSSATQLFGQPGGLPTGSSLANIATTASGPTLIGVTVNPTVLADTTALVARLMVVHGIEAL